jgi:hypothetical protein
LGIGGLSAPGCPRPVARGRIAGDHRAMARLVFTPQLRRFLDVPEQAVAAGTLRTALAEAFAAQPRLQGYVLDDQGHLRAHVVVFIDGRRVTDRVRLDDPVGADSTVSVLQALSGG